MNSIMVVLLACAAICFLFYIVYRIFFDEGGNQIPEPTSTPTIFPTTPPTETSKDLYLSSIDMNKKLETYEVEPIKRDELKTNKDFEMMGGVPIISAIFNNKNLIIKITYNNDEGKKVVISKELDNIDKVYYFYDKLNGSTVTFYIFRGNDIYVFDYMTNYHILENLSTKNITYGNSEGMNLFVKYKNENYIAIYEASIFKWISFGQKNDGKYYFIDSGKEFVDGEYFYYNKSNEYIKSNREYYLGGKNGKVKVALGSLDGLIAFIDENDYLYQCSIEEYSNTCKWEKNNSKVSKINQEKIYFEDGIIIEMDLIDFTLYS